MLDLHITTLVGNLICGKGSLGVSPAGRRPPLLDGGNLILVLLLFGIGRRHDGNGLFDVAQNILESVCQFGGIER